MGAHALTRSIEGPIEKLARSLAEAQALSGSLFGSLFAPLVARLRELVRLIADHTGLSVSTSELISGLVVAVLLGVVAYGLLRRAGRFAFEIAAVALLLVIASELGLG